MSTADFSTFDYGEVLRDLATSEHGLSDKEATARLEKYGPNEIPPAKKKTAHGIFIKQFKSLLIAVLLLAGILSWLTDHKTDAYIILVVMVVDAMIGFIMEWRAEQAVAALHRMLAPSAKVLRSGQRQTLHARLLVPGDIIILEEGDHIAADARLVDAKNLRTIEASLTGESVPVNKTNLKLAAAHSIGDRKNMVWKSTFVASGFGVAVVTATGLNTAVGGIAKTLASLPVERSHFQKKVDRLGRQMGIASLIAATLLFAVGYFTLKLPINELFLVSVAAMVSIIPEGLPGVIVIVLAIGSRRMTRRNAIIREFTSTETLGAVTTIITDKTGTLTENALTVRKMFVFGEPEILVTGEGWAPVGTFLQNNQAIESSSDASLLKALTISGLCNNASVRHLPEKNTYNLHGDPTEGALLVLARKGGIDSTSPKYKRLDDLPFNSNLKMRASLVEEQNRLELFVVGAPEIILQRCTYIHAKSGEQVMNEQIRNLIKERINDWSLDAMRVIAIGYQKFDDTVIREEKISELTFVALAGMMDPPRAEAKDAVIKCKEAGIRVIMATGDHISTAVAISKAVGIIDGAAQGTIALSEEQLKLLDEKEFDDAIRKVNVFARLNPDTKLRIVERLQALGELIAMTGDGVNDAPALKKADVGVAMGIMGTDVARDSAKVVLADDNFSTILNAIEEGRIVFMNAQQASFYLITTNLAEICTLIFATALGMPMPLTAIQILWLNLVTDGTGDMALAAERDHGDALKEKPLHKEERLLNKNILPFLVINVAVMVTLSLSAYSYFLPRGTEVARSAVFIVMSFTQLFNLFNMRSLKRSIIDIGIFSNIYVTITVLSSAVITFVVTELPYFQSIFGFGTISTIEFIILVLASATVLLAGEIYKYLRRTTNEQ